MINKLFESTYGTFIIGVIVIVLLQWWIKSYRNQTGGDTEPTVYITTDINGKVIANGLLPTATRRCNFTKDEVISCGSERKPKCGRGTIFFQNCQGQYLSANRPGGALTWIPKLDRSTCFIIQKPNYGGGCLLTGYTTKRILPVSIESALYHGHYMVVKNGIVHLDTPDISRCPANEVSVNGCIDKSDYTFLMEAGLTGVPRTVTLRPLNPKFGLACIYNNGTNLKFDSGTCAVDPKDATFYIGSNSVEIDWWWQSSSLFRDNFSKANFGLITEDSDPDHKPHDYKNAWRKVCENCGKADTPGQPQVGGGGCGCGSDDKDGGGCGWGCGSDDKDGGGCGCGSDDKDGGGCGCGSDDKDGGGCGWGCGSDDKDGGGCCGSGDERSLFGGAECSTSGCQRKEKGCGCSFKTPTMFSGSC